MPTGTRTRLQRYGIAVISVGLSLLLKLLLLRLLGQTLIEEQTPFLFLAGAVVVSAWYGGLGPGLLATFLSAGAAMGAFAMTSGPGETLRVAFFAGEGTLISGLCGALRSARARAERRERSLRESEERFRLLVDGVQDYAIFMLDPEGRVASWNAGAQRIKGYRREQIVGRHFSCFFPAEDASAGKPERELKEAAATGRSEDEGWRMRQDGSRFWANVVVTALRDENGDLRGFSKVTRDITTRKQAEEALNRYSQRLRALHQTDRAILQARSPARIAQAALDAMRGLVACDLINVMLFDDERLEAVVIADLSKLDTGLPAGARFPLRQFGDLEGLERGEVLAISPASRTAKHDSVQQRFFARGIQFFLSLPLIADGQLRGSLNLGTTSSESWSREEIEMAREAAVQLALAIQQSRLYEELQRHTEQLEELVAERTQALQEVNAELEAFAYNISHDLRAPLRAMQGFGQALLEDYADVLKTTGQDYARRIVEAARRMDALIEDLLAYSRLSREEMSLQVVALASVVAESRLHLEAEIDQRQASITVQEPLPSVVGHPSVLTQAITNLLGNAIKFVPPGTQPKVAVWAEDRGSCLRLWVEDNGIGVAPQHHERIFQVFQRLQSNEAYPGTGIGLAIVRKGVERMGGRAGVESAASRGSRFWIELRKSEEKT